MPPTVPTPQTQTTPVYRVRTMTGDVQSLKSGGATAAVPVSVEPTQSTALPSEPKKVDSSQPQKQPVETERIKLAFPKIEPPSQVPQASEFKPQPKPIPTTPPISKKEPFSAPISKPFSSPPKNQIVPDKTNAGAFDISKKIMNQAPPPPNLPSSLPTAPTPPPIPQTRPLTPPPMRVATPPQNIPMPPQQTIQPRQLPVTPQQQKPFEPPPFKDAKPKSKKLLMMGMAGAGVILLVIIGEIWWFFSKPGTSTEAPSSQTELLPPPQEQTIVPMEEATPQTASVSLPKALLTYSGTETVGAISSEYKDVAAAVSGFDTSTITEDNLVRLVVKIAESASIPSSETSSETILTESSVNETGFADINTVIKALNLKVPAAISGVFSGEYDLFFFGGNSFDKDECEKRKITSPQCSGPRMGLAIKVSDADKIKMALKTWERTMASDLKPLILNKVISTAGTFQTGTYQNQSIRYKNMPFHTTTVEYAAAGDTLIITTSKNSMLKALDALPSTTAE